ncbi:MAG: RnfABCDGE type electron transport complex subunit G [Candidatus Omnitrophica bacterium]|nr:RnfABCDGE type electron transport complex subunit G [Candidatus Omnitrophota bacterium]MBU4589616.1 RnfABCDGE type electron transport complex subunit G [Candidatus Omnitrophota bacterium]
MNNVLKFTLVLFLVNLVAASILAGVYTVTRPRIEDQKRLLQEKALREVMPEDIGDRLELTEDGYWKVFRGSGYTPKGYVFIAKRYGYSSVIETMVGIKADGTITGVQVLSHNETPGLGAKIVEVVTDKTIVKALKNIFSKKKELEKKISPYFTEQFKGIDVRSLDMGSVDAITGATISSKAVVDSIREQGLEILNAR